MEIALRCVLVLVGELQGLENLKSLLKTGIDISILGDNDFYSQRALVRLYLLRDASLRWNL